MAKIGRPKGGPGNTKARIFETAIRLIKANGYENVSINQICQEMGLTKGAFYAHYKSKDQLVLEQIVVTDQLYREKLLHNVADNPSAATKLENFCQGVFRQMESIGKDLVQTAYQIQLGGNPKLTCNMTENRELDLIIEELLMEGQKSGEFRTDIPATRLCQTIVHHIRGIIYNWCLSNSRFKLSEEGDILMKVSLTGLLSS